MADPFIECIIENLANKRFGLKRQAVVREKYDYFRAENERAGVPNAGADAAKRTLDWMQAEKDMKLLYAQSAIRVAADVKQAFAKATSIKVVRALGLDPGKGVGAQLGVVARSLLERDPRALHGQIDVHSAIQTYTDKYFALLGDDVNYFMKNTLGKRNLPPASTRNVVRELFGLDTGDRAAKSIAKAYLDVQGVMIGDLKRVGAMIHELQIFHLPQRQSTVRMVKATAEQWIADHLKWVDWNRTTWPDGSLIPEAQRAEVLRNVYWQMVSQGKDRIDSTFGRGQGRAMGNMLDNERFLHYKGPDEWLAMNDAYMDGDPLDTIATHIQTRGRQVGTMTVLGANPRAGLATIKAIAYNQAADYARRKGASQIDQRAVDEVKKTIEGRFKVMSDTLLNTAPEDVNRISSTVHMTSSIMSAALLKSAVFISVASDILNTMCIRFANDQALTGFMGSYIRAMMPGNARAEAELMAQGSFVANELVANNYIAARYGLGTQYGRGIAARVSETTMRLSLLQRHTIAMRAANQQEMMAALWRERGLTMDQSRLGRLMRISGITEDEWDAVRKDIAPWEPKPNARFFRPLDILDIKRADKNLLFEKFQGMIARNAEMMVPQSGREARAILTRGIKPDNLVGAVLHSAAMFKGFPVTMGLMMGRLLARETGAKRLQLAAALGLSAIFAGAFGVVLRDLASGKQLQPVDDPNFWVRSLANGGAFGVWGDLLSAGIGSDPTQLASAVGGPLAGLVAQSTDIVSSPLAGLGITERDVTPEQFGSKVLKAVGQLTPATFYTYLPLQRAILDQARQFIDPEGARRAFKASISREERTHNRGFWWEPGAATPGATQ